LFNNNGTTNSDPVRLNSFAVGDQYGPSISAAGSGYLAVWTSFGQSYNDGASVDLWEGVFGQFINSSGQPVLSADLHVNGRSVSHQVNPVIVADGSSILAVWSSFWTGNTSYDLVARTFQLVEP
jgi:hypothetical protein